MTAQSQASTLRSDWREPTSIGAAADEKAAVACMIRADRHVVSAAFDAIHKALTQGRTTRDEVLEWRSTGSTAAMLGAGRVQRHTRSPKTGDRRSLRCRNSSLLKRYLGFVALALCVSSMVWGNVAIAEGTPYQTAGGLAVYLGVVPAEIVKGHPSGHTEGAMHGGVPTGRHQYHIVAALFDAATGARIPNASVVAQVSGLGLSGPTKKLEAMEIAGTTTYGAFFNLPGSDLYTVRLTIQRIGEQRPVVVDFKYDHRR